MRLARRNCSKNAAAREEKEHLFVSERESGAPQTGIRCFNVGFVEPTGFNVRANWAQQGPGI